MWRYRPKPSFMTLSFQPSCNSSRIRSSLISRNSSESAVLSESVQRVGPFENRLPYEVLGSHHFFRPPQNLQGNVARNHQDAVFVTQHKVPAMNRNLADLNRVAVGHEFPPGEDVARRSVQAKHG